MGRMRAMRVGRVGEEGLGGGLAQAPEDLTDLLLQFAKADLDGPSLSEAVWFTVRRDAGNAGIPDLEGTRLSVADLTAEFERAKAEDIRLGEMTDDAILAEEAEEWAAVEDRDVAENEMALIGAAAARATVLLQAVIGWVAEGRPEFVAVQARLLQALDRQLVYWGQSWEEDAAPVGYRHRRWTAGQIRHQAERDVARASRNLTREQRALDAAVAWTENLRKAVPEPEGDRLREVGEDRASEPLNNGGALAPAWQAAVDAVGTTAAMFAVRLEAAFESGNVDEARAISREFAKDIGLIP